MRLIVTACCAALAVVGVTAQPAQAYPPGVPTKSQAQSQLDALAVEAQGSMAGYSRDEFPQWDMIDGECNTREMVLKRDGEGVEVDAECYPTAGSWYSDYDGVTVEDPAQVQIDHIVPLAEAWRSGASSWDIDRRRQFANDLEGPQLIAVSGSVNSSKGDRDPASWMPPLAEKHCAYGKFWIATKSRWELTLQEAEKSALQDALNQCSD